MTGATSKCICGFNLQKNDSSTIFVRYFLHVRSSVGVGRWGHHFRILKKLVKSVFFSFFPYQTSCLEGGAWA